MNRFNNLKPFEKKKARCITKKKIQNKIVENSCELGCKSTSAVFFRSASLLTNSKKIKISERN